ncbi:MAG: hypothetical protein WAV05_05650, partial [Anaerolineales bacterium]
AHFSVPKATYIAHFLPLQRSLVLPISNGLSALKIYFLLDKLLKNGKSEQVRCEYRKVEIVQ